MTEAEFHEAFPCESQHVEFKSGVSTKQVRETVAAFANADGGVLFVGVDDAGRPVPGPDAGSGTDDKLHDAVRSVVPPPRYDIGRLVVGPRTVTVLRVWPLAEGVASLTDGRVLQRRTTRDDPVWGGELQALVIRRATTAHQVERARSSVPANAADAALVAELCEARGWVDWRARRLAERSGLIADECLTTLGVLLLTRRPDEHVGRVDVDVLRYPDDETPDYDLRRTFHGPVQHLIPDVDGYVSELLGFEFAIAGTRRVEIPKLPDGVLREALANAVAHRSYERLGSCVVVELRPGSVRVTSPGGLPAGVSIENLRQEQESRNPELANNLRHFHLAEQRGRGIDIIEDRLQAAMLGAPTYEDDGRDFSVTLPLHAAVSIEERAWIRVLVDDHELQATDPVVLVHALRGEVLTNARVQEFLGCDERPARAALQRLVAAGFLERRGERSATTYVIAEPTGTRVSRGLTDSELGQLAVGLARERGSVTNQQLRAVSGVDRARAARVFGRLVDAGELRLVGERRGSRYEPTS